MNTWEINEEGKKICIYNKMKGNTNKELYLACKRRAQRVLRVNVLGEVVENHNGDYKEPPESIKNYLELCKLYGEFWYVYGESEHDIEYLRFYKRGVSLAGSFDKFEYFLKQMDFLMEYALFMEFVDKKVIYDYLDIKEFHASIMINISPKWNDKIASTDKIDLLSDVIEEFACIYDKSYFTRFKYVIENGKNNSHVHAHCVLEVNPRLIKSFRAMVKKNNHNNKLRALWKKVDVGSLGSLPPQHNKDKNKGSLNHVWLNNRELLKDKLDYLIEEKKPEEHKNAYNPDFPLLIDKWVDI